MDIFGTAVTAMQEVYNITMFIRNVITKVKEQDDDQRRFQNRLDVQLLFLDSFQALFFDKAGVLFLPEQLPSRAPRIVLNLLEELKRTLNEYNLFAIKHGFQIDEDSDKQDQNLTPDGNKQEAGGLAARLDRWKRGLNIFKLKVYDWAIFDNERVDALLTTYERWSGNLRDIMQHFLQVADIFNDKRSLQQFVESNSARGIGLQEMAKRKLLSIEDPPEKYDALDGQIGDEISSKSSPIHLTKYSKGADVATVIVEYRRYDRRLREKNLKPQELLTLKAPIRNLAWLLRNSPFPEETNSISEMPKQPTMYTLQCIGYIDEPDERQSCFLYRLPKSMASGNEIKLVTLNQFILRNKKPVLGNRFVLAHALSLTLLNIHGSGWMHKNIWSQVVVLFPQIQQIALENQAKLLQISKESSPTTPHLLPYLVGWESARPIQGRTDWDSNYDVEQNLYRHNLRQGQPKAQFSKAYDIYALGVVLLEIGCWKTLSMVFEDLIAELEDNPDPGRPKLADAETVKDRLVEIARTDVAREMGESYTNVILACLNTDFGVEVDDKNETNLSLAFGEKVVDVIERGLTL